MCYRPITIKDPSHPGHYMQVPCGKCLDCRRKYQNALSNRMYEEYKAKGCKGVFFTLTYDEQHVPKNYFAHGKIYRSYPEYAYSNVDDPNRGRARIKHAQRATDCLKASGVIPKEIVDFNQKRSKLELSEFKEFLKETFVRKFPFVTACDSKETTSAIDPDEVMPFLDVSSMFIDDEHFYDINEDTGECVVDVDDSDFDEITKISKWYAENTPVVSFNSVRLEDVQRWLKRNRTRSKRSDPSFNFSYFVSSEYGPRTLRPHYHGVLFGVTKDDVRSWFRDWQRHFGEIVDFDDLDTNKGGLSYVAKYCSKGMFEHPLCARDFYYGASKEGIKEYHSKHYERSIELFGVDSAFVDPTFHLFSKGLGKEWINHNNLRCEEFEDVATKEFKSRCDSDTRIFVQNEYLNSSSLLFSCQCADALLDGDFTIEQLIFKAKEYEYKESTTAWLRRFYLRFSYSRVFRVRNKQTGEISEKTFAFQVPRYYREKMFGPKLRLAYTYFIRDEVDRMFKEKLRSLGADTPSRESDEKISRLLREEEELMLSRYKKAFDSQKKFFNKSQL